MVWNDGGNSEQFDLLPNFPNPINSSTHLTFEVPAESPVLITVYDVLGREITTLVNKPSHRSGTFTITFDAFSHSIGVYSVRLISGSTLITEKMMLI
jgi:hypothetical protein